MSSYVNIVNDEFRGLVQNPSLGQFVAYEEACRSGELNPDEVATFNDSAEYIAADFAPLKASVDAQTPEGDYLFRCTGYTVVARESGITAVHSALVHIDNPLTPDPVEALYPRYSSMALIKTGRAVVSMSSPEHVWSSLGHAFSKRKVTFAGSTGSLFMHGLVDQRDVRAELLEVPPIADSLVGVEQIDQTAGLADEYRAKLAIQELSSPIKVSAIIDQAVEYVSKGVYVH